MSVSARLASRQVTTGLGQSRLISQSVSKSGAAQVRGVGPVEQAPPTLEREFWRAVPVWRDVGESDFLSYRWSVSFPFQPWPWRESQCLYLMTLTFRILKDCEPCARP